MHWGPFITETPMVSRCVDTFIMNICEKIACLILLCAFAPGALLVYDITDADTFHKVKSWVKELRKVVGPDIFICIAGNKCDLVKQRQVEEKEAVEYGLFCHFLKISPFLLCIDALKIDMHKVWAPITF